MAIYYSNPVPPLVCKSKFEDFEWEEIEYTIDVSYTKSYYPDTDMWLSFHDYIPQGIFATRTKLLSFQNKQTFIHNQNNFGKYYDGYKNSIITPVLKSPYMTRNKYVSALFTNLLFRCDLILDKKINRNKTLTSLSFHNTYQSSTEITLIPFDDTLSYLQQYDNYNIRLSHNYWQFNKFRDLKLDKKVLTWEEWDKLQTVVFNNDLSQIQINVTNLDGNQEIQQKRRFVDEYMIVMFKFHNTSDNYQFLLHDVTYETKPALR